MFRRLHRRRRTLATALLAAGSCLAAQAVEHITLRNGFEFDCVRHEGIDGERVRFFLQGENNYQDFRFADIARVETLPDPPPLFLTPAPIVPAQPGLSHAVSAEPTQQEMRQYLRSAGNAHNIDEELLAAVIHAESGGHARAVSRAGAQGLMQLMPSTARTLGVHDTFQPDQNINGGTAYLDRLLKRYKDNLALALAAYNAGPGAVDRYHGVPPFRETRAYVARVIREFNRRKEAAIREAASLRAAR